MHHNFPNYILLPLFGTPPEVVCVDLLIREGPKSGLMQT